jgi:hypothetical protein
MERYHNGSGWTVHRREPSSSPGTASSTITAARPLELELELELAKSSGKPVARAHPDRLLNVALTLVATISSGAWFGVWALLALTAFLN